MSETDDLSILHGGPSAPVSSPAAPVDPLKDTPAVTSGAGEDELMKTLHGPDYKLSLNPQEKEILTGAKAPGLGDTLGQSVVRAYGQARAIVPALRGVYKEYSGDTPGMVEDMLAAKKLQDEFGGDSQWNLQNIHSPSDAIYWATEKIGEQSVNLAAAAMTGGFGYAGGKMLAEKLLLEGVISQATARAIMLAGQGTATSLYTVPSEMANTAQEQFDVTNQQGRPTTNPGVSLAAGTAKGILELWSPLTIGRALTYPGFQMGKTLPGAITKSVLREGATETAQEVIDISARKLEEPGYSYFKDGPTLWPSGWDKGAWRLAESGAAGMLLGGVMGGPAAKIEQNQERRSAVEKAKGLGFIVEGSEAPGTRTVVPAASPEAVEQPRDNLGSYRPGEDLTSTGPVTALRQMILRPASQDKGLQESLTSNPRSDALGLNALLGDLKLQEDSKERFLDLLEANTPRFVDVKNPTRVLTDTEIELHDAVNRVQGEKPQYHRVNQGSLQPAAISAHLNDLAPPGDPRIYFLDHPQKALSPEEKVALLADYGALHNTLQNELNPKALNNPGLVRLREDPKGDFLGLYNQLLTKGLRVIPSRGAGFFYNGTIALGAAEDVKTTKRTDEVAWYDPISKRISPFTGSEAEIEIGKAFGAEGSSILVALNTAQLKEGSFIRNADGSIELKQPWDGGVLTPGITPADESLNHLKMERAFSNFLEKGGKTGVHVTQQVLPGNISYASKLADIARKIAPGIDQILKRLGIDKPVGIYFTDQANLRTSPAWANMDHGAILIVPEVFKKYEIAYGMESEVALQTSIMHELGHIVTFHYYKNLPVEIKDGLLYAWGKAQLAGRMGDYSKTSIIGEAGEPSANLAHWLSLPEWLAEQFRRWGISDQLPTTIMEKTYKDGGRKLEAFYREWEKRLGSFARMNLQQPDHFFTAAMDYLRGFADVEKPKLQQSLKRYELLSADQDIQDSPVLTGVSNTLVAAFESLKPMLSAIPGLEIQLKNYLSKGLLSDELAKDQKAAYTHDPIKNLNIIEIAVGALKGREDQFGEARSWLSHEGYHALERVILTEQEKNLLTKEALANRDKIMPQATVMAYAQAYREQFEGKVDPALLEDLIQKNLYGELRAHYVESFANTGIAYGEESHGIMARILAVFERIRNYFEGFGYQTKEDLLRAIFKGEMVHRADRVQGRNETLKWINAVQKQFSLEVEKTLTVRSILNEGGEVEASDQWERNGKIVKVFYEKDVKDAKRDSRAVIYHWYNNNGRIGELILENKGPKGFSIEWVETTKAASLVNLVKGSTLESEMIEEAQRDLGVKFPLPNMFTAGGYITAKLGEKVGKIEGNLLELYSRTQLNIDGELQTFWVSPNFVRSQLGVWREEVVQTKKGTPEHEHAKKEFIKYRDLLRKLPENIQNDPRLEKMFSLKRNFERDEVQGSLLRSGQEADEAQLRKSLGFPHGDTQDAFSKNFVLSQKLSQAENARVSGLPFNLSAPSTMYSLGLRNIWGWATKMEGSPWNAKELKNLAHEADRIGFFTKLWISIKQLAQVNEHHMPIQNYVTHLELAGLLGSKWHQIADETKRFWDNGRSPERMQSIIDVFFGLNEMKYRTPQEVKAGTQRLPGYHEKISGNPVEWNNFLKGVPPNPNGELAKFFKDNNLKAKDWEVIRRVTNDFSNFLAEAELLIGDKLKKKLAASPQVLTNALAKLASDMGKFRTKPYFPMMRFGQFTLAMRVNGQLVNVQSFGTMRERNAAQAALRAQYPTGELTRGQVPEHSIEFMGLPAPLLQQIKENLLDESKPGLTSDQISLMQQQKEWIAEFELLHDPDKTFRKRWLPSRGVPGYSLDAMRVYAHYFNSGSRYLSRLAYLEDLRKDVADARALAQTRGDQTKATKIADYMESHLNYYLEGGRDGGKFRAAVALWFLGFSPIAAMMNWVQPFTNTVPYLAGSKGFGFPKALTAYLKTFSSLGKNMGYATGNPQFEKARQEMIRQEYISVGQGAELASFAEMNNISKLRLGTKTQNFYRKLGNAGMWMFQGTEHYAREATMHAAWHLAMENPSAERLQKLDVLRLMEIADLQQRLGMSHQEAVAFVYAKEVIDRTQFGYNRVSDAPIMRGSGKNFLIFFKFTQSTLFAFGHNGAFIQMMFLYLMLYGLSGGIPGGDDANEFIRMLSKIAVKLGLASSDLDLQESARSMIRGITKGTIFDEVGPDLAMHGISRYGMGMGLLPGMWGVLGGFDASANGSIGKVLPGFADAMHGLNNGKDVSKTIADGVERAAGAGYGTIFAMLHALNDPGSVDSKKWTAFLPRALKGVYNAYRYLPEGTVNSDTPILGTMLGRTVGAATNQLGAKIPGTKFDPMDWMDVATVLEQAAGLTPRKVSQQWEALRAISDVEETFKQRRSTLIVQLDKSILEQNIQAQNDVFRKIQKFDEEVAQDWPQFIIKGNQLAQSLKQRNKQRGTMEALGVKNKGEISTSEKILENYPAARAERVR